MYKAVFLDRDGLINEKAPEHEYIRKWEEFRFLPGVPEAIRRLNEAGYLVLVVTNQRGVARGLMTMEEAFELHSAMCAALERDGARIARVYMCPHEEGSCTCRKPDIGLFLQAERDFAIDKSRSWMVGDSDSDIEAGRRYGVRTIKTGKLSEAAEIILQKDRNS